MITIRLGFSVALLIIGADVLAQGITGRGTFPQFRSVSGLPGGGYPVEPSGRISLKGHLALSTPIAYSIRQSVYAGVLSNMSSHTRLTFFDNESGEEDSNGTFVDNIGFNTRYGQVTLGGMRLSKDGDAVLVAHWELPWNIDKLDRAIGKTTFGYGIQDILSQGGSSGEDLDRQNGGGKSNSWYLVSTTDLGDEIYASAGIGVTRFRTVFANVSAPLSTNLRGYAEFDGYGFNVGAGFRINPNLYSNLALVNGKYAFWGMTLVIQK